VLERWSVGALERWSVGALERWSKQAAGVIRGPKWPKEHSPGFTLVLPWVNSSTEPSPEGAGGYGDQVSPGLSFLAPSRN
jgi:hypothetical protein